MHFFCLGLEMYRLNKIQVSSNEIFSIFRALIVKYIGTCIICKSKIYCKLITIKAVVKKKKCGNYKSSHIDIYKGIIIFTES